MINLTEKDFENKNIKNITDLFNNAMDEIIDPNDFMFERIAKYLLQNGLNVPPVKVGDTIYFIFINRLCKGKIIRIDTIDKGYGDISYKLHVFGIIPDLYNLDIKHKPESLDIYFNECFLSKEEAEKAFKLYMKEKGHCNDANLSNPDCEKCTKYERCINATNG